MHPPRRIEGPSVSQKGRTLDSHSGCVELAWMQCGKVAKKGKMNDTNKIPNSFEKSLQRTEREGGYFFMRRCMNSEAQTFKGKKSQRGTGIA